MVFLGLKLVSLIGRFELCASVPVQELSFSWPEQATDSHAELLKPRPSQLEGTPFDTLLDCSLFRITQSSLSESAWSRVELTCHSPVTIEHNWRSSLVLQ